MNKDYYIKHQGYYDDCRLMEDNIVSYIWWIGTITDMFYIYFLDKKRKNSSLQSIIYLNITDNPIVRIDNKDPIYHFRKGKKKRKISITCIPDIKFPIYCFGGSIKYKDIYLPIHDIYMFLFGTILVLVLTYTTIIYLKRLNMRRKQ